MTRDPLWDCWNLYKYSVTSPLLTRSERGRINKALKELREVNATPEDMKARIAEYQKRWPQIEVTITALAANWASLKVKPQVKRDAVVYVPPADPKLTEAQKQIAISQFRMALK